MLVAAIGDTGYNVMLLLHIVTAFVAFSPGFVHPLLAVRLQADGGGLGRIAGHMAKNDRMIHSPALLATGLFGFGVAGMSEKTYSVSQGWLVAAVLVWIAMNGVLHAVVIPAERAVADGNDAAAPRISMGYTLISLLVVIVLVLMVWKPGV